MMYNIEIIAEDNNRCGEAPLWDSTNHRLIWVDAEASLVFQYSTSDDKKSIISRDLAVSGIALNRNNSLIVAGAGLHLWRGQDNYRTIVSQYDGESLFFNDIIADSKGRIYAGTYYWETNGMEKTGKLYLIDIDGSIRVVDDGIKLSNGLGFSPENRTLYYADSAVRRIYAYDVDINTGNLSNKRNFVEVPSDEGIPDGLTVDADGYVWSAQWYGEQVVRYDPDGKAERRIPMPVKQVSSVMFGGLDLTDLYITTAGEYWSSNFTPPGFDSKVPMGGSLYRIRLDIKGKCEYMANF
ncbi:MAG: SMP-30/gluconolactonase/LRE family protein [bacterium]|nr:SMP-30/gluconolactonase/LRE family protein [bacterium]